MKSKNLDRLVVLLAEAADWASAPELASALHTTTRTIRNYVRELNETESGQPVVLSGTKGYRWNREAESSRELYHIVRALPETPQERADYLIRKLLFGKQTGISALADSMMVSDRTVQLDLEALRPMLRKYGLRLHSSREDMSFEGPEHERRRLAFDCIIRTVKTRLLTKTLLIEAFPEYPVEKLEHILLECLPGFGLRLNGYFHYDLLLMILIQLARAEQGKWIRLELPVHVPEDGPDKACADTLAEKIEQITGTHYLQQEVKYLALLILCEADYDGPADSLLQTEFADLRANVEYAFDVVRRRIGAAMPGKGVPQELIHHIHRMILRSRMHFTVYDPVSDSMRSRSPYLYDCCAWAMTQMIEAYKIRPSSGEVAFLALRLSMYLPAYPDAEPPVTAALICPDFGTTGTLLVKRIEEKFSPRLRLTACIDHVNLEELPSAELYLSILPLNSRKHAVLITPFLNEQDCVLVYRELSRMERMRARGFLTAYLESYSGPQFFETAEGFSSREDAVRYICSRLEEKEILDSGFSDLILRREYAADTVAYHEIAMPHACTSGVRKNTIYILKSKTPIPWGGESVKMVFFMALHRSLLEDFKYIYCLLLRLLGHPKCLAGFAAAESFPMLMEQLSNFPSEY